MKRRALIAGGGVALLLAACGKQEAQQAPAKQEPVSLDVIASEAKGFDVGTTMAAHVVYVFFDPQCPHCAELWESARPLKAQARFVWIPVGLLNAKSAPEGAALLAAPDPVAAMDQHEASMRAHQGGVATDGVPQDLVAAVKHNTELMNRFGFGGVPTIVAKQAQTGELLTVEGALPTQALAQKLGFLPPTS